MHTSIRQAALLLLVFAVPSAPSRARADDAAPAAAETPEVRHASIGGVPIALPAVARSAKANLPVSLVISADARMLLAALLHRGWAFHLAFGTSENTLRLAGKAPNIEFEHSGAHIDERLKLYLWRRPQTVRGLPLWAAATGKITGVQPLQPATEPPRHANDARDRVLADLSFSLSETKHLTAPGSPQLAWIEVVAAPEGAEDLVPDVADVAGANSPMLEAIARAAIPDAGPVEARADSGTSPLTSGGVGTSEPRSALHLAVAESVQAAVQGIQKLEPLPPPAQVPAEALSRPPRAGKRVALTFDACSTLDRSFYDERVMNVLRETRTPATLFLSGRWAETHQETVRALAKDPLFEIANHSYVHPHMLEVSVERQEHELLWTQQILLTLTGKLPRFFRPPYGEMDQPLVALAATLGLRTVEYDFPSGDPDKNITKERMVKWVLAKAKPGSIVVMHMNRHGWHTGEALPEIIAGLRQRGFELARVGDLVDADEAAGAKE